MAKMKWDRVRQESTGLRRVYQQERERYAEKRELDLLKLKAQWERLASYKQKPQRSHQDHRSHLKHYDCDDGCLPGKHVHTLCGRCQMAWPWKPERL